MNLTQIKLILFLGLLPNLAWSAPASGQPMLTSPIGQQTAASAATRRIGIIKAINGNSITLTPLPPDTGAEASITVTDTTRILRIAPGEKDLKNAATLQLQDLQVGDHILVGGKPADDGKSINAASVVVMKATDVQAKQQKEQQDWQKRGTGGIVCAVDPSSGTVTISAGSCKTKTTTVQTSKTTVFRRYALDSVKFDDAKPSTLAEIHIGDQLRARGDRTPDGGQVTADEIVTGTFRNIAGIVNSVDASSATLTVQDLLSKKPVQIKVSSDSQLHQLPPEMAQRVAMRLKASAAGAVGGSPGGAGSSPNGGYAGAGQQSAGQGGSPAGGSSSGGTTGGMGGGMRQGGPPDLNQMLARTPVTTLADVHKGDAVIILATEGSPASASTAITLVSGVEPILRAAPSGSQAMMLSAWTLGGPTGDAGNQ
jgi:co-chaperonin GroES (HSP10)